MEGIQTHKSLETWTETLLARGRYSFALEQYTQLFSSFIMPLAQNNIEIQITSKGDIFCYRFLGGEE